MKIHRAYKFKLRTTDRQAEQLSRFAGCCRLIWNKVLNLQKERLDRGETVLRYGQISAELPKWKQELPFLAEVHSQPLQQSLMDLDRALQDAFCKTKGFPKFKKKFQHDSFRYPQGIKLDGDKIYLPKIGWFEFRKSREIEGTIKNVTVSKTINKWYVSIQVEFEVPEPVHPSNTQVGIDMGVIRLATMSDGTVIQPINIFRVLEPKLAKEQRKLARKIKFSNKWKKQKTKIQIVHHKIASVRGDFLHKTTTIAMEVLKVKNMSKSAKGSIDEPGTNVAAKSGLNKSITDQGWYEFKRQLMYKQQWSGGKVVLVNPMNSSRTCSRCNHCAAENRRSQALFQCQSCGYCDNADLNAAKNILAAGQAVLAHGDIRQFAV
jgi:putative transposase